jgi:hypothetical protein
VGRAPREVPQRAPPVRHPPDRLQGRDGSDKRTLEEYLGRLQSTPISDFNQRESYWINLYNALTVKVILDHYPVKSIRSIKPNFLSLGPWDVKLVTVESQRLSLNDIERRILRPIWKDPRLPLCRELREPRLPQPGGGGLHRRESRPATHGRRRRLREPSSRRQHPERAASCLEHLRLELAERLKDHDGRLEYSYDWELNEP